ncbi:GIY-YIG nuclease family protein [Spirulina subsalsa FACHB-351]|uniref:GIY-YIG nuclease family protein n=1 Tax=Spirulina subsalsa FACHB-351 TaxID=234711 RepID=A0ABT3L182_9CYAN|nr:GIY-YIG nuclease family protein [Spirulina subsalsa FACHB-351]
MTPSEYPTLASLEFIPYLTEEGKIAESWHKKIGVYAIFDQQKTLQLVNYSRDIEVSLKQHLVRKPFNCYWLKIQTIDRPIRTILEEIKQAWLMENGAIPLGNDEEEGAWNNPIDAKFTLTEEEQEAYQKQDDLGKIKLLKKVARRLEAEILKQLEQRGVTLDMRFNPKLKEQGLLDLK